MMISDLPYDLEVEILSRVPATSLAKLQTTCKRWYALFRDPHFIKKNLGKEESKLMLLSNFRVYSISVDQSIGKISRLKNTKSLKISKIFYCDGLVLCSTMGNTRRLVVWDPCTGQTLRIKPRTCYHVDDYYAFGYVNSKSSAGHSYRILRYYSYENDENQWYSKFEIYEFSSDSWKVLDKSTHDYILFVSGVSLKGNTYWVAGKEKTGLDRDDLFMLYFDFTAERFGRFPLPFRSFNPLDNVALSVVGEEKLAVLHQNVFEGSNVMRIFLTNKIDHEAKVLSWSNFVLTVDYDRFHLRRVVNVTSFLLDEENKVAVCSDIDMDDERKTRIYIVGEDIHKEVYKESTKGADHMNWPHLVNYVPSLVDIKKHMPKRQKKRKAKEVIS